MGDSRLPASSRWTSWTREAKLWSHLESHLEASHWPLECPHPLCSLQLPDETMFLYHLDDVHSLRMSPNMNKRRLTGRNSEPLVNWTPGTASHKRKRQDRGGQDLRSPKRTKGPLQIKLRIEQSSDLSLDRKTPDRAQATASGGSSEASITQAATDDDPQDLPDMVYSKPMSPPDTDELHSMDTLCLNQNFLQKELNSELRDLPETNTDEHESSLPGEDALFSQYLHSRSPSCFSIQGIGGNHDSDGGIYPQTVNPRDICLCAEEDPHPADLIDQNAAKPEDIPVKTHITLRICQPKPRPKPKVLLRLIQPKQAPAQRSLRQGIKNRRRRT